MSSATVQIRNGSLDNEFYIPIANLTGQIFALNQQTESLSTAAWAALGSRYLSSVNAAGAGVLRDCGVTYLSGGRTFSKIQLVVPQSNGTVSTFGVNGAAGTVPYQDYLIGYIETGFDATGTGAPTLVAKIGR